MFYCLLYTIMDMEISAGIALWSKEVFWQLTGVKV